MKEDLKKILIHLAAVPGVSGSEGPIAGALKSLFEPRVDDVTIDPMGNVIARKNGSGPGPKLMLACHSDTIGCIVRSIDKNGFMRLFRMGGAVDLLLVGRKVWVNDVPGVVGGSTGAHSKTRRNADSAEFDRSLRRCGRRLVRRSGKVGNRDR